MKIRLKRPYDLDTQIYSRILTIGFGPSVVSDEDAVPWSWAIEIGWRWLPLLRWRYTSRAWQGWPPAGTVLASEWTGRERELIGWEWPLMCRRRTAAAMLAERYNHRWSPFYDPTMVEPITITSQEILAAMEAEMEKYFHDPDKQHASSDDCRQSEHR